MDTTQQNNVPQYKPQSKRVTEAKIQAFMAEYDELVRKYGFTLTSGMLIVPFEEAPSQSVTLRVPIINEEEQYGNNSTSDEYANPSPECVPDGPADRCTEEEWRKRSKSCPIDGSCDGRCNSWSNEGDLPPDGKTIPESENLQVAEEAECGGGSSTENN